jgi:amino acid adenylation domain-containing protein
LPLTFHKRSSDAPLIGFLPVEDPSVRDIRRLGACSTCSVPAREIELFRNFARQLNTTLEDLLLAAFAGLLARMTRQEDIEIAVGRLRQVQFKLEAECSFRAILESIPRHRSEGLLQSENPAPGTNPVLARTIQRRAAPRIVRYEFRAEGIPSAEYSDCGLQFVVLDNGLKLDLASPSGQWQEQTLRSWLGYLRTLLGAASQNPDLAVDRLPLWDESTARRFYTSLNSTAVEFPGESSVPGRIALQAKMRPDATAVVSGDLHYTYRELDERSTELARHLIALGAGPNYAVAVCMERSIDLPLALLAVLKSGAFYVPLDPGNPNERLRGILQECNPVVLLSDKAHADALRPRLNLDSLPLLCVDGAWPQTDGLPAQLAEIDPEDLAYTIYTSGTTGKPKGVRIRHNALLNLVCSMWRQPGVNETDRTLAAIPISFDVATMDMFLPLCSGGALVVASRQDSVDPYRLARLMDKQEITFMQATPATWRMLVASGWTGKRNLKMSCGGEALSRDLANDLVRLGGELWNCYGPTETAICSAVLRIEAGTGPIRVGPPIANTSFYVMDKLGNPLPPGMPGELYIGGVGVSPGYVARPELTAQRFIPDPYRTKQENLKPEVTLFRTGDLVRIVNGNQLEFFGRLDDQVKLRGFRIEIGEIEAVLRSHPSISDAVVMLREDIPGEPRLVAYVICPTAQVSASVLGEFAARFLPEYMLPTLIVTVERFPLSANGKIDRRALPIPESIPGQIAPSHPTAEDAADDLEMKLLKIFRETLRNDSIGVTDSFFRYGGYSLLTVRLFSRIDRELHVRLPISLLFDAPTVRELARVIRTGISPSIIVPIRPYGRSAPIFLIQSYLLYSAMLELVEADRPVYGVREMGDEREQMSTEERARLFASEIVKIYPNGPLYLAGWCAAGSLTVEIARQLREAGHPVGLVALFDAERPGFVPPQGVRMRSSRLWKKLSFHSTRLRHMAWRQRANYIAEAIERNWEWAVDSWYAATHGTLTMLQKRFGISISETAFHHTYANMSALDAGSVRPYPGRLNLYRAMDVPDLPEIDTTLGWGTIAQGGVAVDFVPGDHVSMFKKPHITSLAHRLQQEMQRYEASAAHS